MTNLHTMNPFQKRVVEEKRELEGRIGRLKAFMARTDVSLPEAERNRLTAQLHHMESYAGILGERIGAFE